MSTRPGADAVPERLLDVKEAAAMLAVKPATLYQWAYQRRIPVVKLFGPRGALRFRESDIRRSDRQLSAARASQEHRPELDPQ